MCQLFTDRESRMHHQCKWQQQQLQRRRRRQTFDICIVQHMNMQLHTNELCTCRLTFEDFVHASIAHTAPTKTTTNKWEIMSQQIFYHLWCWQVRSKFIVRPQWQRAHVKFMNMLELAISNGLWQAAVQRKILLRMSTTLCPSSARVYRHTSMWLCLCLSVQHRCKDKERK